MKTLLSVLALAAACTAAAASFVINDGFPAPAPGSFNIAGTALPDGRLAIWNGDAIFLQTFVNAARFDRIASGYAGDPAFLALAPDGRTLLLGPGGFGDAPFRGQLYTFDTAAPENFNAGHVALTGLDHFSGAFLDDTLVLVDAGKPDFSGSELVVADLSAKRAVPRAVVTGLPAPASRDAVVEKPPFTYSGAMTVDRALGIVYVVSAFGSPQEIRYFAVAGLIAAYLDGATLDWNTDGVRIGAADQFAGGGVAGVTPDGLLVNGGLGGIQLIDPSLDNPAAASVVETFDPAGTGGFYSVIYNPVTDSITALVDGLVFTPSEAALPVPAAGWAGLLTLASALAWTARRRARR